MKLANLVFVSVWVLVVGIALWFLNGQPLIGIDDANIYFVYMRNVAMGNGFVYNLGEAPVEGFTSVLWTLIGALFYLMFQDGFELPLLGLCYCLCSLSLWYFVSKIGGYLNEKRLLLFTGLVLTGLTLTPGYFEWSILTIMDASLWHAILLITFAELMITGQNTGRRNEWMLCSLLGIMVISRPESLLWCLVIMLIRLIFALHELSPSKQNAFKKVGMLAAAFLISLGLLVGLRLFYFGYPLPNTYYAKVSVDRLANLYSGFEYLTDYWRLVNPLSPFIVAIGLVVSVALYVRRTSEQCNHLWRLPFAATTFVLTSYAVPYTYGR